MATFLFFILGLGLLILGSRSVVENALALAGRLKISPLIIGISVVAAGTSLPEIMVSIFGGLDKGTQLALGNIVGSNIANIGLIFGLTILIYPIRIGTTKTPKNMVIYFFLSLIFFWLLFLGQLKALPGIIFLILGFLVLYWQILQGQKGAHEEDKELLAKLSKKINQGIMLPILFFVFSLLAVILGGKLLVDSGIAIARFLNVPQVIIGITAVAAGTSLPELAVSLTGLAKKEEKLVVGNILGSNIFNLLLGGGILGLFKAESLNNFTSIWFFLISSLLFCLLIYLYQGQKIPRYFGLALLLFYASYFLAIFG